MDGASITIEPIIGIGKNFWRGVRESDVTQSQTEEQAAVDSPMNIVQNKRFSIQSGLLA